MTSPAPAPPRRHATLRVHPGPWTFRHPVAGVLRVRGIGPREGLGDLSPFDRQTNPQGWSAMDTFTARFVLWTGEVSSPVETTQARLAHARERAAFGPVEHACLVQAAEVIPLGGLGGARSPARLPAELPAA